jgi:hypothetical protein
MISPAAEPMTMIAMNMAMIRPIIRPARVIILAIRWFRTGILLYYK